MSAKQSKDRLDKRSKALRDNLRKRKALASSKKEDAKNAKEDKDNESS